MTSVGILAALVGFGLIGVVVWVLREIDKISFDLDEDDE